MGDDQFDGVRSVERATRIIQVVADAGIDGCRFAAIVSDSGLTKTTTHRILGTLVNLGWLEQSEDESVYYLGLPLVPIGITASNRHGIVDLAAPHLQRLAELTGDTLYLVVRIGDKALCIDRHVGDYPIKTTLIRIGDRRPLGSCGGSLALLTGQPQNLIEELIVGSSKGDVVSQAQDFAKLPFLIEQSQKLGYSIAPRVWIEGASGIGVPVFGADGSAVAAISLEAIDARLEEPRRSQLVHWIQKEAAELSEKFKMINSEFGQADIRRLLSDAL